MSRITLSFGYDTERPYGAWARDVLGAALRARQIAQVDRINRHFDALGAPRTFFLLGDYLEQCAAHLPPTELRGYYNANNPLIDLQQHSHSHPNVREIPGRPDEAPVSAQAFGEDVRRASKLIREILGAEVTGMRIPRGYDQDLCSLPDVVAELERSGIRFVSSDLRSPSPDGRENFEGALTRERQPHSYAAVGHPGVLEIPSHGYQDVVFTEAIAQRQGIAPLRGHNILAHYCALFDHALQLATDGAPVHIALCLHPFALLEYDPQLELHRMLIGEARKRKIELLSYAALAERVAAEAASASDTTH